MDLTGTFAEGAMRKCFRMKKMSTHHAKKDIQADKPSTRWATQQNYVAKTYKDTKITYQLPSALEHQIKLFKRDLEMQMVRKCRTTPCTWFDISCISR